MTEKIIYRGCEIHRLPNGNWVVKASDGETLSSQLNTEERAYHFVDNFKRMGGK